MKWESVATLHSLAFTCGFCGNAVATREGYYAADAPKNNVRICPHCTKPTYFEGDKQIPGIAPGAEVANVPPQVDALYREARNCIAASCYTAAVLTCRKLLMHLAVAQGAKPGDSFVAYIEFLAAQGYVPPNGRGWVDHIRKKGNEANHEIVAMKKPDADELVTFSEMLLKFIYEFPAKIPPSP